MPRNKAHRQAARSRAAGGGGNLYNPLVAAFAPTDITGLKVWLKADALSLNDGDAVTTWTDSSGNTNSPTQATAGNKPTYKANIVNSKPVVRFGGVTDDDLLQIVTFTGGALSQPNTMYVAYTNTVIQAQIAVDGGAAGTRHILGSFQNGKFNMHAGTTIDGAAHDTTWHVHALIFNGASSKMYLDGGAPTVTGDAGAQAMNGISVGGNFISGGLDGDVFEILVYNGLHTTTQLDQVGGYAATRINTTWTAAS